MNPKHLVLSLDYDGTLNWYDTTTDNFVTQNSKILDLLLKIICEKPYETVTIISGSARQNYAVEKAGSYLPPSKDRSEGYVSPVPSTEGLIILVKALNNKLGSDKVRLDKSLLCDLHRPTYLPTKATTKTPSTYFDLIRRNIKRLENGLSPIDCADSLNDSSKFLLLTWQMEHFNAVFQGYTLHNNHIDFYFIDDLGAMNHSFEGSRDLITPLIEFFRTNPREIPGNVTLHAIEAHSELMELNRDFYQPVHGQGFTNQTKDTAKNKYFERAVLAMQHMPAFRRGHIDVSLIKRVTESTLKQVDLLGITNTDDFLTGYQDYLFTKNNALSTWGLFSVNNDSTSTFLSPAETMSDEDDALTFTTYNH